METIVAIIIAILVIFGMLIYSSFSWGFVCMKFWMWFILPLFPMLPVLSFIQCVGLMFFIGLFNIKHSSNFEKSNEQNYSAIGTSIILPWITLFFAWIIKILFIS